METVTPKLADLDVLYTYEASAAAAITAYATAAARAYHPDVRGKFKDLTLASMTAQKQARDLIVKLGGTI